MKPSTNKKLVLVGGGHSHVIVLNLWSKNPLPNVEVILVSPDRFSPYSGMLPGLVAGHYSFAQTHIDLQALCSKAQAAFVEQAVVNIDPKKKIALLSDGSKLGYELLSINSGIKPKVQAIDNDDFIPVKPISTFYPKWQKSLSIWSTTNKSLNLVVVGGGAAGVELVMAMAHRLAKKDIKARVKCHLVHSGDHILSGYPEPTVEAVRDKLTTMKIDLLEGYRVDSEDPDKKLSNSPNNTLVLNSSSKLHSSASDNSRTIELPADSVFWCTQADATAWANQSDLSANQSGFITVNEHLQSINYSDIFAAGDVADFQISPLSKAGVFAVRQGPILFKNLQAALLERPPQPFKAQETYLSLLAGGGRWAAAGFLSKQNNGGLSFSQKLLSRTHGKLVWHWKDWIDRQFMRQFK